MSSQTSQITVNHEEIRKWAEERGGRPASVKGTEGHDHVGLLRIDFEGNGWDEHLQEISWDEFFEKFDEKNLAFLFQDETKDGHESRFFKFISRDEADISDVRIGNAIAEAVNAERVDFDEAGLDETGLNETDLSLRLADRYTEELAESQGETAEAGFGNRESASKPVGRAHKSRSAQPLDDPRVANFLNEVIEAELTALDAYQQACENVEDDSIRDRLNELRRMHEDHILEIENLVFAFGGEPIPLLGESAATSSRRSSQQGSQSSRVSH